MLEADASQGLFRPPKTPIYKPKRIEDYYESYLNHDLIRQYVDDLVESAVGQGCYTTIQNVEYDALGEPLENDDKKPIDEFCQKKNLDSLLPNITRNTLIAGFVPVETRLKLPVEKSSLKIIHPKTVKEIKSEALEISLIQQKVGQAKKEFSGDNLAWFMYCPIANDPRGTSLVRGALTILNTLENATADVQQILERYIAPIGVWKSRRSIEAIKKAVMEADPNEDIFLGELTPEEIAEKIVEFVQIDPRVPFWDFIAYMDQRVYKYFRASDLWYTRNATQASAEVMEGITRRHVNAIQRGVKRSVEKYWFARLIALNHGEEVPKLNFGHEPTGVEDIHIDEFLTMGVEVGYISQNQYYDILNQLGVKIKQEAETGSATPPETTTEKQREGWQEWIEWQKQHNPQPPEGGEQT